MLTIITGQPGAGKTLLMIQRVRALSIETGRPVFYCGINGLSDSLGWIRFEDARTWADAPEGAIIAIDEAWEAFPTAPAGSKPPAFIEAFATHRHRGHDIFLTMQHTTQLHTFPRKMCGCHLHVRRLFGASRATIFEWPELGEPNDYHSKKNALTKVWSYPTDIFDLYKSATLHTVQRKVPWSKLAVIPIGIIVIMGLGYGVVSLLDPRGEEGGDDVALLGSGEVGPPRPLRLQGDQGKGPVGRVGLYDMETWRPELAGLEYTARFYDELIEAKVFPKISGCYRIDFSDRAPMYGCNSQQGTRLSVSAAQARYYVENGWFDFTGDPVPPAAAEEPVASAAPPALAAGF